MSTECPPECPPVWVIIVTFNGKRFLEPCFRTLSATDYPNLSLLLLDNGSTDDSAEFVRENFPHVHVLSLPENNHVSAANNHAIDHVLTQQAKYLCIFNDDIETQDPRWLRHAVELAEQDPRLGIIGFTEVNPPDRVVMPEQVTATEVDYMSGFAIMVSRSVLESVGKFDECYKGQCDEDDLESRAIRAGFHMKRLSIPIFHHAGGTMKRYRLQNGYLQMRDGLRFCIKNRGLFWAAMRVLRILDVACNPLPISFDPNDSAHRRMRYGGNLFINSLACLRAVSWNFIHLPETIRIRRGDRKRIRQCRDSFQEPA